MPDTNLEKLKKLLAELFMFDQADLDFGIYRIMNAKRDEITRFLDNGLLPQVRQALGELEQADRTAIEAELAKAIEQAKGLGVDPDSAQKVKELRQQLAQKADVEALESEVFSDLYNFFRRYYNEGDFLSLRRYKEGVYAIPYEGEEVKLHWANADQYYIKTTEYFRDYTFKLPDGRRVHFKLAEAHTEQNNNKPASGQERRFILREADPIAEENGELVIRFEYRPDAEKRKQADLNAQATQRILQAEPARNWLAGLATKVPTKKNPDRTLLDKRLADYTARNTFDYFIHKDLGGFLRRELDFYIKNEVMHLDDIESESAPRVEQYLARVRAIRRIAHKIIDFLAQLENFQKKLWLKKKFVVETHYCVTLDRVPQALYPEIAANDAQREEWVRLFAINEIKGDLAKPGYAEPLTVDFLKANPYLVLDTRHFSEDFKRRLLASFDDLDEQCDGLLIHSENFQALNLVMEKYREKVKCVYIDPPYNTGSDEFIYKDNYQHSSWLTMMADRLVLSKVLMREDAVIFVNIDDIECGFLKTLMRCIFGKELEIPAFIWKKKGTSTNVKGAQVSSLTDYILASGGAASINPRVVPKEQRTYPSVDKEGRYRTAIIEKKHAGAYARETMTFKILGRRPSSGKRWQIGEARARELEARGRFFVENGKVKLKIYEFEDKDTFSANPNLFLDRGSTDSAQSMLTDLFGIPELFSNPKPVELIEHLAFISTKGDSSLILDFFAGSGTTGHSVINLNREDGSNRKFILVDMGEYFDTILVPRIKKAVYSKDWKDGKPVSREGISHMFKYIRLESYEDTLNNLELKRTREQRELLERHPDMREDYVLRYMLDVESQGSASLLSLDRFEDPFNYKLKVGTGSAGETRLANVDLVETFNWLLGLRVKHMDSIRGFRVVQGTNPGGEKVLVIWRNTREKPNPELDEFFLKQGYNTRDMEFDLIYVNGDNNLENLKRPDETWKVRMIEEEFKRLMFDVQDV